MPSICTARREVQRINEVTMEFWISSSSQLTCGTLECYSLGQMTSFPPRPCLISLQLSYFIH